MEWMIISVAILLLLTFFVASSLYQESNRKKRLYNNFVNDYGNKIGSPLSKDDYQRIAKYHEKIKETVDEDHFILDEITWNDLNLDDVFAQMNTTLSSVGEEYLYHRLHCMSIKQNRHDLFSMIVEHVDSNPDDRLKLQKCLYKLGKIKNYSITDIIYMANNLAPEKNQIHYIMDLILLISIGVIFIHPGIGVLTFIIMLFINILTYFKRKSEVSPYFTTFAYIVRLTDVCHELEKQNIEGFSRITDRLKEIYSEFKPFTASSRFLVSGVKTTENILELLLDYIRMILHFDIIKFNSMLKFMQSHIDTIEEMRVAIGSFDAAIAVASYRRCLPYFCVPEFVDEKCLKIDSGYHPLISDPIPNDTDTKGSILITGSNASGKSTYLKMVALSAVLAQTVGFVPAVNYRASYFRLLTSMALKDDINRSESYFIVEIKSLKRIIDVTPSSDIPVLCMIDEVLRGTNTVERIAASSRILRELTKQNILCFAATHDIELTEILKNYYTNYHFDEDVKDHDIIFSYRIKEGKATSRNAIKLLSVIGYDEEIIVSAENDANRFMATQKWDTI